MRSVLGQHDVQVELGTELRSIEMKDDSVIASVVVTKADGSKRNEIIQAQYLIGADGARGSHSYSRLS
jgi:2-polyprenyl-6-methoxyphenol hydroxylase-like FAD-dependent oxidoreductase